MGRWVKARTQTSIELTKTSALTEIEGVYSASIGSDDPGGLPTTLKE